MKPRRSETFSAWVLLGIAVALEALGAIALHYSHGFTQTLPAVASISVFSLSLFLVSKVMKHLPVSIAYPVWAGGGTAVVALTGVFMLGEDINAIKVAGISLIVLGVIVVNRVSEKPPGC